MSSKKSKKVIVYKKKKKTPESEIIEKLQSQYNHIDESKLEKFEDLPLSPKTLKGLTSNNYTQLTDIQKQSLGLALQGYDILGAAKTGSGKTLAFIIPILEILYCKRWTTLDGIGAIVITPTRELAYQIYESLRKIGCYHDISAGLIIGGKDLHFEKKRMDQCNIIICTPGRLLQHMDENPLFNCITMQILVLDEADRCLDMGFEKTMNAIIENFPPKRQTLLFSATQTKSVKDLARLSLKDPKYVSVHEHATHITPDGLQQSYIVCPLEDKIAMLWSFLRNHLKHKVIVFFASCKQVKYTYEAFCRLRPGVSLLALYGTLHQLKRMDIYETFCKKQHAVLFATDIAARGLDFPAVHWVVQMDCPEDVNAYIHRAGRTARFQSGGESLLVLLPSETGMVEKLNARKIPINMIKINPNKLHTPQRKLEALLARDVFLKETAQRAVVAYIKSICLMKDKDIFNISSIDTDSYAKSLGLAVSPRIRFLQRMQKKLNSKHESQKQGTGDNLEIFNDDEADCSDHRINCYYNDNLGKALKPSLEKDMDLNTVENDDSEDENILSLKRKNISVEELAINILEDHNDSTNMNKKKALTKAAMAKKVLRKKIVPNKKTTFDDDGQELINSSKHKMSEMARLYENETDSGINIEIAKQVLREEDHYDKQRFKEKIKEKHRQEKQKQKAKKKLATDEEPSDDDVESEFSEPDTSWLPDPDKIYGKEENKKMHVASVSHSSADNTTDSEDDTPIHKPPKRKLITQEEFKKMRKKSKKESTYSTTYLQADEELALQLLHS